MGFKKALKAYIKPFEAPPRANRLAGFCMRATLTLNGLSEPLKSNLLTQKIRLKLTLCFHKIAYICHIRTYLPYFGGFFAKIVKDFQRLAFFAKDFIIDVCQFLKNRPLSVVASGP